jgi:hypothetical protein
VVGFLVGLWIIGGAGAAILGVAVAADNPRIVRAGRIGFALLLAADLFAGAAVFAIGQSNSNPAYNTTQSMWWLFALAGGIPLAFVSGFLVRRAYVGHRLVLWSAVSLTAALWLVFPLAFTPAFQELRGLGRFAHTHHALDVVVLLLPSVILLVAELFRHAVSADQPTIPALLRRAPRRITLGVVLGVVVVVWLAGASSTAFWLAIGTLLLVGGVIVGLKNRAAVRQVRHDLK